MFDSMSTWKFMMKIFSNVHDFAFFAISFKMASFLSEILV